MSQSDHPETAHEAGPAGRETILRITALEWENRRLRRLATWVLVIVAVLLGLGAALVVTAARRGMPGFVPEVVEAREFVLRDREGRVRGAWGQDDQGAIRFVLQDAQSQMSVKLNLLDDGTSGLTLSDSTGNPRLLVALLPDETVNVVFADGRGITRTVLGLARNGASTLIFGDGSGHTRAGIGVDGRGRPMLTTGEIDEEP
jgi:hypothetical protein